jgi:hypothetical protein
VATGVKGERKVFFLEILDAIRTLTQNILLITQINLNLLINLNCISSLIFQLLVLGSCSTYKEGTGLTREPKEYLCLNLVKLGFRISLDKYIGAETGPTSPKMSSRFQIITVETKFSCQKLSAIQEDVMGECMQACNSTHF